MTLETVLADNDALRQLCHAGSFQRRRNNVNRNYRIGREEGPFSEWPGHYRARGTAFFINLSWPWSRRRRAIFSSNFPLLI